MRRMIQKPGDHSSLVTHEHNVAGPFQQGGGQHNNVPHTTVAPAPTNDAEGREPSTDRYPQTECSLPVEEAEGLGQPGDDTPGRLADPFSLLYMLHRDRQDYLRSEVAMTSRIKARLRWRYGGNKDKAGLVYDDIRHLGTRYALKGSLEEAVQGAADNEALFQAERMLRVARKGPEREMIRVASGLPLADWVKQVRGLGMLGFAQIMAEAGDLSNYAGPAKLWKRFGVAVINGEGQRRHKDKELAALHGFSPSRRAVLAVIGDSMVKQGREYREVYLARKEYEATTSPDLPPIAHHRRAKRYMEKRLLRDLWQANKQLSGSGEAK